MTKENIANSSEIDNQSQQISDKMPETSENQDTTSTKWFYATDLPGQGEPPEWFNHQKYRSVCDQAKAQRELEQKLGHFQGAPSDYQLDYPENYPDELKFSNDDLSYQELKAQAKKYNISNQLFNELHVNNRLRDYHLMQQVKQQELSKLGDNAQDRLMNIQRWAQNNLNEKQIKALHLVCQSAEVVELVEQFIEKNRDHYLESGDEVNPVVNEKYLQKRVNDPRYRTDNDFREETSRMFREYYDLNESQF